MVLDPCGGTAADVLGDGRVHLERGHGAMLLERANRHEHAVDRRKDFGHLRPEHGGQLERFHAPVSRIATARTGHPVPPRSFSGSPM